MSTVAEDRYPFRPIQFGILLTLSSVSIPCFVFVLHHILTNRALFRALNNHVIIALLVFTLIQTVTDIPLRLSYYFTGKIWPRTVGYCMFYSLIDFYLFTTSFLLLTWASFERHILIFRSRMFNVYRIRLLCHYVPLSICITYPLIYYIVFIIFYPCESYYDETISFCFAACYLWTSPVMALYEQIVHGFALMFLIFVSNLVLLLRIVRRKNRMGRQMTWAKNRMMALQLFSVCFAFFITNTGYFLILLGQLLWNSEFGKDISPWTDALSFCMPPLIPFFCISTLQGAHAKLKRLLPCSQNTVVRPVTTAAP